MRSRWLLSGAWLRACEEHYASISRQMEEGPVKKLGGQCADYLDNKRQLPLLLLDAFRLAPAPKLVRLNGDLISVTSAGGELVGDMEEETVRRERSATAAHEQFNRIMGFENEPSSRLALNIWQWMRSRRKVMSLPRMIRRFEVEQAKRVRSSPRRDSTPSLKTICPDATSAVSWNVAGPAWFDELMQTETGVRGWADGSNLHSMIGVDASVRDDDVSGLLDSASRTGRTVVIWFLDGNYRSEIVGKLNMAHVAVVCDKESYKALEAQTDCRICRAAPAIQPAIHNPIGWWNGNEGIVGKHENDRHVPPAWKERFNAARGFPASASPVDHGENRPKGATEIDAAWIHKHQDRFLRARKAWLNDAISHRLDTLAGFAFGQVPKRLEPLVSVIVPTMRPERVRHVFSTIARQSYTNIELILVLNKARFDKRDLSAMVERSERRVLILRASDEWNVGELMRYGCGHANGIYIAKMDDDDYYGANFIRDQMLCLKLSQAQVTGLARSFIRFESDESFFLRDSCYEYEYNYPALRGGTLLFRSEVLEHVNWRPFETGEDVAFVQDCRCELIPVVSGSMFNYAFTRRDESSHTWKASREYFEDKCTRCNKDVSVEDITC